MIDMPDKTDKPAPELFSFGEHFGGLLAISETSAKQFAESARAIAAIFEGVARDFARSYPQMEAATDRLADLGWTIPMLGTPRTFVELADPSYSDSKIGAMLLDFYADADYELLRTIQGDILKAPLFAPWRELLNETFEAFFRGHYQIVVPALLMVTEGVVAIESSAAFPPDRIKVVDRVTQIQSQQRPQSIEALMWRSLQRWIAHLFQNSQFSGTPPARLNRHWILHGRDAGPWTATDATRLFASLHMLSS